MSDTYRISIPLLPASQPASDDTQGVAAGGSIMSIEAAANPTLNAEAVLVRFELSQRAATYTCWDAAGGAWVETGDFSGGVVSGGGKVEITGQRETLLPAFAKVHQYLYDAPLLTPVTFTHNQPSPPSPVTPTPTTSGSYLPLRLNSSTTSTQGTFTSSWRFPAPTTATSANNTPVHPSAPRRNEIAGVRVRAGGMGHAKQRSLSAPIAMPAEFEAARNEIEMDVGLVPETYGWGASANTNRWGGVGAAFDSQQQTYQEQKYGNSPLRSEAMGEAGEGWAFQYDTTQDSESANSGYPASSLPGNNTFQLPTSQLPGRSHSRYPSFSDRMGQRGESEALSLQSHSSSGSNMPRTDIQGDTPPFIFDSMMSAGQEGYEGEMKAGVSGMNLGGMDMEVLDEM